MTYTCQYFNMSMTTNAYLVFKALFILSGMASPRVLQNTTNTTTYYTSQVEEPDATLETYPQLWRVYIDAAILSSIRQSISQSFRGAFSYIVVTKTLLWQNFHRCSHNRPLASFIQDRASGSSTTIASVCGYLSMRLFNSNMTSVLGRLEIQTPPYFFLNVTVLEEKADKDSICFNKMITIEAHSGELVERLCGKPYLPRTALIPSHIGQVQAYIVKPFTEQSMTVQYQIVTKLPLDMMTTDSCSDCIRALNNYEHYIHDFTESNAVGRSSHSNRPAIIYTWMISVSKVTNKITEMLQRMSLTCMLRNCTRDVVTIHDGPYVGALAATGLMSPFPLLLQSSCMDPATENDAVESALGEVTITLIDFYPTHVDTVCTFAAVPIECPDAYCKVDNLQVDRTVTHRVTSLTSDRPFIHLLQFTTREPRTNIHVRIEVLQAAVSHSYFECTHEGLYIFERILQGSLCTGDALRVFNSSARTIGLQFNDSPVTVMIKNYSPMPGIKLIVDYTGTNCYGLVNTCYDDTNEPDYRNEVKLANTAKSCYVESIKRGYALGLKLRLAEGCCFVATFLVDEMPWTKTGTDCLLQLYSSRDMMYKWELTRHIQPSDTGQPCPELRYDAIGHPVTLRLSSWSNIPDTHYSNLEVNNTSMCGSNFFAWLQYDCFPTDTLYMLNVTICEDKCSHVRLNQDDYSGIANSHRQDKHGGESRFTNSSFLTLFSPYHLCGSVTLPYTPQSYWFAFNYRINFDLPQGDVYCCLTVVHIAAVTTDRSGMKDVLRRMILNSLSAGIPGCKGEIVYSGVPRSIILRNFIRGHRPEYFTLEKTSPETSYSMTYYMSWLQEKMLRSLADFTPSQNFEYDRSTHRHTACSGRSCYKVGGSRVNTSWQSARALCQDSGGDLLSINDDYEWNQISYLVDSLCLDLSFIPIGLTATQVG